MPPSPASALAARSWSARWRTTKTFTASATSAARRESSSSWRRSSADRRAAAPLATLRRMPLLYVDMLGMKARYHRGGPRAALNGYRLLGELVREGLEALPDGHAVSGGVQSDAVCLQFASVAAAVTVGRKLFSDTFRRSKRSRLLWVRGVIVDEGHPEAPIET